MEIFYYTVVVITLGDRDLLEKIPGKIIAFFLVILDGTVKQKNEPGELQRTYV